MNGRVPLVVSGDMHAVALGKMQRSGTLDLSRNPINVALSGSTHSGTDHWQTVHCWRGLNGVTVDGVQISADFPMKPTAAVLSTVANPKAGPKMGESGEDASPRKTTDLPYVGPHEPGIRASRSWLWP